jgi:hypothetical protein
MNAGRKLDALVAEKVFGAEVDWSIPRYPTVDMKFLEPNDPVAHGLRTGNFPPYSTDIAAAWAVVDHLRVPRAVTHKLRLVDNASQWEATFLTFSYGDDVNPDRIDAAFGETPAHAICLASLKVTGSAI